MRKTPQAGPIPDAPSPCPDGRPAVAKRQPAVRSALSAALLIWLAASLAATAQEVPDAAVDKRAGRLEPAIAGESPAVRETAPGCRLALSAASLLDDLQAALDGPLMQDALDAAGDRLAALGGALDLEAAGQGLATLRREAWAFARGLDRTVGPASPLWSELSRLGRELARRAGVAVAAGSP